MPVKKRRRNNTNENVAQLDTSNNNDLEKEIEIFIPLVIDILEGTLCLIIYQRLISR
jgi:hypothetical protein